MKIPHTVRIGALVLATTAFYAYVGQMVPQKEVQPPQEIVIKADLTTADMVKVGREIMEGKGLCFTCHTIGKTGALRFPDLEGVDCPREDPRSRPERCRVLRPIDVRTRTPSSCRDSIRGCPSINKPPIGLTDQEILCVIAYLQSLGGTPTVTLQTSITTTPAGAAAGAAGRRRPRAGAHGAAGAPATRPAATAAKVRR